MIGDKLHRNKNCRRGFTPLEIPNSHGQHNMQGKNLIQRQSLTGFTLIEMLVTIAVFTGVIVTISGIFISGIREQKRALVFRSLLDQTSYALEYMSRSLRLARKQIAGLPACLSHNGLNYEITYGGSGLKFINHLQGDDCQEFFLSAGQLKYRRNIDLPQEETLDLTSNKLEVTSLKFYLTGETQSDNLQPRVTVLMNIRGKGVIQGQPEVRVQTTISQRNLDVVY